MSYNFSLRPIFFLLLLCCSGLSYAQDSIYTLKSNRLKIVVAAKGAELQSLVDMKTDQEYMWNGDPSVWERHSPILFPIVGALKDGQYYYNGNAYKLPQHGFARDMNFSLQQQTAHSLTFFLSSNEETLVKYPFSFGLYVTYTIDKDGLTVTYKVINNGAKLMYFSIGGHPAFRVPLFSGDEYGDYELVFNKKENAGRWQKQGKLISQKDIPFLQNMDRLPLQKSLFYNDAIILHNLASDKVRLLSSKTKKGFELSFGGFPYLGIWAAKNADFVCIEPWCGLNDVEGTSQQLQDKVGVMELKRGGIFTKSWSFRVVE